MKINKVLWMSLDFKRPQSPTTPPVPTLIHKKGRNSWNSLFSMKLTRQWGKYLLFSYFLQKGIGEDGGWG